MGMLVTACDQRVTVYAVDHPGRSMKRAKRIVDYAWLNHWLHQEFVKDAAK